MKGITNKTHESFEFAQHCALIDSAEALASAFKKRIHQIYVNPDPETHTGVYTVVFEFDKYSVTPYEKKKTKKEAVQKE